MKNSPALCCTILKSHNKPDWGQFLRILTFAHRKFMSIAFHVYFVAYLDCISAKSTLS